MSEDIEEIVQRIKKEDDIFSRARLVSHLLNDKKVRVIDLARKLGINSSYVCHINRLNKLPDIIIDAYYSKLVSVSHLFLLSRIPDFKKIVDVYEEILSKGLSIQATENLIREHLYGVKPKGGYVIDKERVKMEEKINRRYPDVKAKILQTRVYSKMTLEIKGSLDKTSKTLKEIAAKLSD
jgi:hypothetical protein